MKANMDIAIYSVTSLNTKLVISCNTVEQGKEFLIRK